MNLSLALKARTVNANQRPNRQPHSSEIFEVSSVFCFCVVRSLKIACWLERRTRDREVASSNSGESGGRIFFSRVNFVFCARSTPVLPQWHVKDPGHSAKSAAGRLHLNTHTPLTQRSRSGLTILQASCGNLSRKTSSYATRQETLGHSRLSLLSHCRLT